MLVVNCRCPRWSGDPAGDGEIAMDTVAEPSLRQPVHKPGMKWGSMANRLLGV
jgi:hypothetical protein